MQAGYFNTAWSDIKNTPNWFGKTLLLALVACIPIFGWIVVGGYLYGWARDIAWGVHGPMPKRIFGNEDGKLYSRGFFVMVIGFVCLLIPWILELVWGFIAGFGAMTFGSGYGGHGYGGVFALTGLMSLVFFVLTVAAAFLAMLFRWVGSMRMSIYGRLSAGLQFGKIWAMIRHDFSGLLRIFGMVIIVSVITGLIFAILSTIVFFIALVVGLAVSGSTVYHGNSVDAGLVGLALAVGGVSVFGLILAGYAALVVSVFMGMLVVRALGYWTRQFDVPAWRGQDDPMPFELARTPASPYPPHQQPPVASQPYSQPPRQQPTQAYGQPTVPSQHAPGVPPIVEPVPAPQDDSAKKDDGDKPTVL